MDLKSQLTPEQQEDFALLGLNPDAQIEQLVSNVTAVADMKRKEMLKTENAQPSNVILLQERGGGLGGRTIIIG